MKVLVNELFGITMKEVDIPLEERWDIDTTKEEAVPSKGGSDGLRKFEFHHEVEGPLRTFSMICIHETANFSMRHILQFDVDGYEMKIIQSTTTVHNQRRRQRVSINFRLLH